MKTQRRSQTGFTLIELIMVIVILGILSAVAMPRFINLSGQARLAQVQGFAGALASGSAINYASRSANVALGDPILNCTDLELTLQDPLPGTLSIDAAAIGVNISVTCTIRDSDTPNNIATFSGLGIL